MHYSARYRSLLGAAAAALVLCVGLGLAAPPARADDRHDRGDRHERDRGRDRDRGHYRDRDRYHGFYEAPVYAPPPFYAPPVAEGPGINLIFPLHFR